MAGGYLHTCSRCGRHIPPTLWYMHVHNPDRVLCRVPQCRAWAVGYCGDEYFELSSSPLCETHLIEHHRRGHDARLVDGTICSDCDGRGGDCPRCSGSGYISEMTLDTGRRRAEERDRERAQEDARRRAEETSTRRTREEEARREQAESDEARRKENRRREERLIREAKGCWLGSALPHPPSLTVPHAAQAGTRRAEAS